MQKTTKFSKITLLIASVGIASIIFSGCSFKKALVEKYSLGSTETSVTKSSGKSSKKSEMGLRTEPVDIEKYYANASSDNHSPNTGRSDGAGLDIWNDPVFQKQFMGSYGIRSEIEPEVTEIEQNTMTQILTRMADNNNDEAKALLENIVGPDTSALFDFILGNIYFQEEDLEKAEKCFKMAVLKFPDFLRAHKNLAMVKVRKGDYENAISSLTRTMELGGGEALTYGLLGYSYTSVEDHVNSEFAYRQAMLLQPDSMDWQMGLAQTLFKQEKYTDSAALCSQMILRDPENDDYWRLQANAYLGMDESLKAAQNYEYLRSLGKADMDSLTKLGDIYVKEEMLDMASDAYAEALEKSGGQSPEKFIRNATILANYGGYDDAEALVEKIEKELTGSLSSEQELDILKLQARIALNKGANDKQAELLQEVVRINPLDGEALILLGQYFGRKDDMEQAAFYYERAEDIEGVKAKAKIRHAQLLVQQSKYQDAVPLLESALQIEQRREVEEYLTQVKAAAKSRQ